MALWPFGPLQGSHFFLQVIGVTTNRKNRQKINTICSKTELIKINMIGKVLRTPKEGNIIICPQCCMLTTLNRDVYDNSEGVISCGCISYKKCLRQCIICHCKHDHKENLNNLKIIHIFDDIDQPYKLYAACICKNCADRPVYKSSKILKLSLLQGIKQKTIRFVKIREDMYVPMSRDDYDKYIKTRYKRRKI